MGEVQYHLVFIRAPDDGDGPETLVLSGFLCCKLAPRLCGGTLDVVKVLGIQEIPAGILQGILEDLASILEDPTRILLVL